MSERERLIELLDECRGIEGIGMDLVEKKADHLLASGVIAIPCKVGDTVYCDICDAKDGDFCDECIVKSIEIDKDSPEPLYTVVCYPRAEYRTYWASDFGKEFFKEPRFSEKRTDKRNRRGGQMKTSKLKPCPFCGSTEVNSWTRAHRVRDNATEVCLWCDRCGGRTDYHDTEEKAARAWNRRTTYEKQS